MKVTAKHDAAAFQPVTLSITLETAAELNGLTALMGPDHSVPEFIKLDDVEQRAALSSMMCHIYRALQAKGGKG